MLVYDDIELQEKIKIYDKGLEIPPYYDTFAEFHFSYRSGDTYSPRVDEYEPLRKQCDTFLECIKKEIHPPSDGYNGLRVVSILEAASKSLRRAGKETPLSLAKEKKMNRSNGNGYSIYSKVPGKIKMNTLCGFVNSQEAINKAVAITRSVKGVNPVKNDLIVK